MRRDIISCEACLVDMLVLMRAPDADLPLTLVGRAHALAGQGR